MASHELPLHRQKFAELVKSKRGDIGLRTLASEIGVSASTLSRVEQGNVPDLETYFRICRWLNVSSDFILYGEALEVSPKQTIINQLRAEEKISSDIKNSLISLIHLAYSSSGTTI